MRKKKQEVGKGEEKNRTDSPFKKEGKTEGKRPSIKRQYENEGGGKRTGNFWAAKEQKDAR